MTGSGFQPGRRVYLLVGDGTITNPLVFTDTAEPDGTLRGLRTGNICGPGLRRVFVANDGRVEAGQQVTSNTVEKTCPL